MQPKYAITLGFFVVLFFVVVYTIFSSWFTVDQGERGVILRYGAVSHTADPGLGFKVPWIDSVVRVSIQSKAKMYQEVPAYSRDQQTAHLNLSVNYRIPHDKVAEVYANYGGEEGLISRLLDRQVNEKVKTIFGRFNAVNAIQDRSKLNFEITNAIQESVTGPIIIESVQIENIDFSDAYEQSIEQRMLAEVSVQKVKQEAEREKIQAEIAVTQAKGRADSAIAEAKAEAEAIRLRGEAEAASIKARGDALKENPAIPSLITAEKWDGKLPSTFVPGSSVPFVNVK